MYLGYFIIVTIYFVYIILQFSLIKKVIPTFRNKNFNFQFSFIKKIIPYFKKQKF